MSHKVVVIEEFEVDGVTYRPRYADNHRMNFFTVKTDEAVSADAFRCEYSMFLDMLMTRWQLDCDPSFAFDPDIVF